MRYRKVSVRVWNDRRFRALSDDGKLAFFFCLTHPHMTPLGAMRATPGGLAEELGWTNGRMEKALDALAEIGIATQNRTAAFLGFPKFLSHNPPESPNVVKSWAKTWELIPECPERDQQLQVARDLLEDFHQGYRQAFEEAFAEAFAEAWRHPSPNQEQEQEQEQEKKKTRAGARGGSPDFPENLQTPEFLETWTTWEQHRKEIRKTLTPTARSRQLATLSKLGSAQAIATIETSIQNGWTGIFPEKAKKATSKRMTAGKEQTYGHLGFDD